MEILPVHGIAEIAPGVDLAREVARALAGHGQALIDGDVLVVTQKIVSKAENRFVELSSVDPSRRALELAAYTRKDPRLVELVLAESSDIVRAAPHVLIARHRLGLVMANAGIDRSNIGPHETERVLLLPVDPDASASRLRATLMEQYRLARLAVIISDSFGRPWRIGTTNIAIGAAGVTSLHDQRGGLDRDGRALEVTQVALADALAAAAGIVIGEANEGTPAALIRGVDACPGDPRPAAALIRPVDEDLFR